MSVVVKALTKSYGNQKALNAVSFELKKGEIAGFIGPNGSGKSTTMKCICGILPPDSGTIEVGGIDVHRNKLEVKKIIGYLPEHNPLYLDMYVREYLIHIDGFYKNKTNRKKRLDEIIELTGLTVEMHKRIGQLSKGYRQRVGLAQSLIHNPEVLILDEPTTGLDPNQIIEIRNTISKLSVYKTVLLSTHILQEVEAICDRIIIINQGEIVANDSSKNIRSSKDKNFQTIFLELSTVVAPELLNKIKGISKVQKVSEKEFLLAGNSKDDLREKIFTFAAENKLTILTIQKKEETLEQAFRKLTTG
ncbi:Linearmycin resistance ATP-binding protein LnrL [subsurface metagenome]